MEITFSHLLVVGYFCMAHPSCDLASIYITDHFCSFFYHSRVVIEGKPPFGCGTQLAALEVLKPQSDVFMKIVIAPTVS